MPKSTRINVRFPGEVWQRILAASSLDGVPPTLWVVQACSNALGGVGTGTAYVAPRAAISPSTLLDPHQPIRRS